jgi:putative phosphoesterase
MLVGVISDIHCNIAGLDRALAYLHGIDEVICAGDAIYQYRFSNEVVDRLRQRGVRMVLGNHEETFLSPAGVRARSSRSVRRDALEWLASHETQLAVVIGGKRLVVVHGSPWEPHSEYLFPNSPRLSRFSGVDADYVILGHTHYQMTQRVGRVLLINPGSAGEPRDPRNGFQLSAAILDTNSDEVTFYDFVDPTRVPAASPILASTPSAWAPSDGRDPGDNGEGNRSMSKDLA